MPNDTDITKIGVANFRNIERVFGIRREDRRKHAYVIGKTGMGKSVLLENMAIQDIKNGNGLAVVDPHGELAEKLLDFVPSSRVNDVVYINPADFNHPIAFNIMENVDSEYRHLVASGLMAVFKKVWPDVWSARMEYILNNTLLALLEFPNSTLLGINRILAEKEYRKKVLARVTDPVVNAFWSKEFARYNDRFQVEAIAPIQNKVGQFVSTPVIRNIVGQTKSSVDMRDIMDTKKILIINLSKGKIGEDNSRLLGALLITKLQLAAMSRVDTPEERRSDFFLYVDEFQSFATESFATILSEARKYRLALILAHQYTAQLITDGSTRIRDAVFGNVGTIISFRVGAEDAELLEKEFSPEFLANDIVNLSKYNIYLKLMIDGVTSKAFSAHTLPPAATVHKSHKEKIIKVSRERYGTVRSVVEEKIVRWSEGRTRARAGEEDVLPAEFKTDEEYYKAKEGDFMELKEQERGAGADERWAQQKKLYEAMCSKCKEPTQVIFEPDGKRPVYCKKCYKDVKRERETVNMPKSVIKSAPVVKSEPKEKIISLTSLAAPKEEYTEEHPSRFNQQPHPQPRRIEREAPREPSREKESQRVAPARRESASHPQKEKKPADLSGLRDILKGAMDEMKKGDE